MKRLLTLKEFLPRKTRVGNVSVDFDGMKTTTVDDEVIERRKILKPKETEVTVNRVKREYPKGKKEGADMRKTTIERLGKYSTTKTLPNNRQRGTLTDALKSIKENKIDGMKKM